MFCSIPLLDKMPIPKQLLILINKRFTSINIDNLVLLIYNPNFNQESIISIKKLRTYCFTLNHLFYMCLGTQYLDRIVLLLRLKLLEPYVI